MPSFDIARIRDFVSPQEQAQMRAIALEYLDSGVLESNPRGPGRFRAKIWDTPHCTEFICGIGERVIERFQLAGCPVDPQLGWIISLLQPGAHIHPHVDKYPYHQRDGSLHLRCNVMVARPDTSGNPVIAGRDIDVPERCLWGFFPSEVPHGTRVIAGTAPRIAFQFGFTVPGDYRIPG